MPVSGWGSLGGSGGGEPLDLSKFETTEDFNAYMNAYINGLPDLVRNNPEMVNKIKLNFQSAWNNYTGGNLDTQIKKGLNYEFPEGELGKRLNTFGQSMTAQEQAALRNYQESFAGRTGGRMSSARGAAEIGGQAALARSMGSAQIMQHAFDQELQMRMQSLQAYIQKYGYDKQAEIAMKELQAQMEASEAGFLSELMSTASMIPFLFKSPGNNSTPGGSGGGNQWTGGIYNNNVGYNWKLY